RVVATQLSALRVVASRHPTTDRDPAPVAPDLHRPCASEVRGNDQLLVVSGAFQQALTCFRSLLRMLAEAAVVGRFEDLHRAVQNIADEDGAVLTGLEANDRRTGCVAGRRLQAEVAVDAVAVLPQHGTDRKSVV